MSRGKHGEAGASEGALATFRSRPGRFTSNGIYRLGVSLNPRHQF